MAMPIEEIKDSIRQYFYNVTDNYDAKVAIDLDGNIVHLYIQINTKSVRLTKDEFLNLLEFKNKVYECIYYLEVEELIQNSLFIDNKGSVEVYGTLFDNHDSFFLSEEGSSTTIYINEVNLKKELERFNLPIDWDSLNLFKYFIAYILFK